MPLDQRPWRIALPHSAIHAAHFSKCRPPPKIPMDLLHRARAFAPALIKIRRDLHRYPELAFEEIETARRVASELRALDLVPQEGVGSTGVTAEIGSGSPPFVALRADMDALPILEDTGLDFSSTRAGIMHACGHDGHVAILLGAARLLTEDAAVGRLPAGTIRLLFQPAEESAGEDGVSGAPRLIAAGAMTDVEAVAGLHLWAHRPLGEVALSPGPVMAGAEEIQVTVKGRGAHAARPHQGVDAILLAAQGLTAAQMAVSRSIAPGQAGVVSFGTIVGGTARNAIPDQVTLTGTLRYFEGEVRDRLVAQVTAAFEMLERHGAKVAVTIGPGYPPLVNDPIVSAHVAEGVRPLLDGALPVRFDPILAAEDFAFLAQTAPGCFIGVGAAPATGPTEHHAPDFNFDEDVIPLGAAVLASAGHALLRSSEDES